MRQIPKTVRHLGIISPLARDNASDNSSQVVLTAKNELLLANIIVYRHQCLKPGPYYGQNYVGVTLDDETRRRKWDQMTNVKYGGKKVTEARNFADKKTDWSYVVHENIIFTGTWEEIEKFCDQLETKYIALFDSYEHGLNGNRGGKGMCSDGFTPELRARIGKTSKGRKMPPESVAKRAAKLRGRKNTPETIEKMKNAPRPPRTPEQRVAQSARMKGKNPVAATEAAKKWQAENPGGWWSKHPILPESIEKRKITVREKAQRIKVTDSNNVETCYSCQTDAAKATGVADGSIKYALDNTKGLHAKSGYRFERISDDEYQEWKKQNPD